jgi:methyl-accepting chemotaxis protein
MIVGLVRLGNIDKISHRIDEKDFRNAEAANIIDTTTRTNARRTMELFIADDLAEMNKIFEQINKNKKTIDDALATLDALTYLPEGLALLAQIKPARKAYVASFSKVGKLLKDDAKDQAVALMKSETIPALDALDLLIRQFAKIQSDQVHAGSAEISADIKSASTTILWLGVCACAMGSALAYRLTRSITVPLGEAVRVAQKVATGDLSSQIEVASKDETGQLLQALQEMNTSLVGIVTRVRSGTDLIATASSQIAAGNLDLSSRTEEQASSLEETASSMEEMTSTVRQNADNARQANTLAVSASGAASEGGTVVAQVVRTMNEINASSGKIVDIISVIDGIAFQTNILALNAAVEAARAGEQGRGFAVVASEVRNLAQRSAAAAKEIKILIHHSVEKISLGSSLVDQAGATMGSVVDSVKRVSDIISEIAAASQEQQNGIEQINQAIMQMDTVTQKNASLVEEAAAAAESMQVQAGELAQTVSVFKLTERTQSGARTLAPVANAVMTNEARGQTRTAKRRMQA